MSPYQQGDDGAGVIRQILDDFGAAVGADAQGAAVNLLGQNGEDLQQKGQGRHVVAVPGKREGES